MKLSTLIVLVIFVITGACMAGTNITVRVLKHDAHPEVRREDYYHGTNKVLYICRTDKSTSIHSTTSGYSFTHADNDNNGTTDSIHISTLNGILLEILKRGNDGTYSQTPQDELDEIYRMTEKIKAGIPKRKK